VRAGPRRMASWFQYPTFDSAPSGRMCQQVASTRSSGFNPLNEVTTPPLCPPNRDCGLACAAMALSALLQKPVSVQDIVGEAPQQAAWSIDLAHLLAGRGLKVVLCTRMPGVDTSHARLSFYAAQMEEDAPRVERPRREHHGRAAKREANSKAAAKLQQHRQAEKPKHAPERSHSRHHDDGPDHHRFHEGNMPAFLVRK